MTLSDTVSQAWAGLSSYRLRSMLSSLGIVVGVATVMASLAIGEGARRTAIAEIGQLGIDNVFARSVTPPHETKLPLAPELTVDDAAAVARAVHGLDVVTVARWARTEASLEARTAPAWLLGVSSDWDHVARVQLVAGRWLASGDEQEARRVAIVGGALARRLAAPGDLLGRHVVANGELFVVVGVLQAEERQHGTRAMGAVSVDDALVVPVTAMDVRLGEGDGIDRVSEITVHVTSGSDITAATSELGRVLAHRHPATPNRYEVTTPRELLHARLRAQRTFDAVLLATGFIALLISGVGVMNMMLASVAQRAPEIGVRRAFGARRAEIVQQFTVEAALLCLSGGAVGLPLGVALSWVVSVVAGWPVAISLAGSSLALSVATVVGLAFGIYPASRAACLDPIVALRS